MIFPENLLFSETRLIADSDIKRLTENHISPELLINSSSAFALIYIITISQISNMSNLIR